MAEEHTCSEAIGAAGEKRKSRMTLFRDDRAEDVGAILLAILVVAIVVVMTVPDPLLTTVSKESLRCHARSCFRNACSSCS